MGAGSGNPSPGRSTFDVLPSDGDPYPTPRTTRTGCHVCRGYPELSAINVALGEPPPRLRDPRQTPRTMTTTCHLTVQQTRSSECRYAISLV